MTLNATTGSAEAAHLIEHDDDAVERKLQTAADAQRAWAQLAVADRAAHLGKLAQVLRAKSAAFARMITEEMGKAITEAEAEIEKCAWTCDFYAENAATMLADEEVASSATYSAIVYDPLGVVLAVMPWNYPFWQVIRFAAPTLAAGNGAILKHAGNVPRCALALEAAIAEAGFPAGLFATLLVPASRVAGLIDDPRIAAVTLTGSTAVGRLVAAQAGKALKKQVLELGGSDPFIVLADAEIPAAARAAAKARFHNCGQSCISAKRFIVEAAVADQFVAAMQEAVEAMKVGDPLQRDVSIGPMARGNLRDELHAQVERSIAAGATCVMGGHKIEGDAPFYAPTILDHVTADMPAGCEETFGPVAAILRVRDVEEAIAVANSTEFGLGASLWTSDLERARKLVRQIEAGAVFVNAVVASDARLPFGGIKQSGYGRELGALGIREFTNAKTVWTGPNH
ncbi:MAG: NAD-dependent succinate-semialdehyde dehydrogenase [Comamonadaceae bacterium]|nr:MAG: NAD-dependent succinate-semialdehyde dehydrogenase [Comamonadaceae bacterium]